MHLCCANCAVYPVSVLRERGITVTGFWYNPNIHPFAEYRNRLGALKKLQTLWSLDVRYIDHYGLKEYLRNVVGRESERCTYCYAVRLEKTAQAAKDMNADAFTTSLLVSPYQKTDIIMEMGKRMQELYSVEFYMEDFRKGFREGVRMSRQLELYQQKYCGCIYSEMERYNRSRS